MLVTANADAETARRARFALPADPASVGRARYLVRERLATWGTPDCHGLAALLTSEVVTNAVRFADRSIELALTVGPADQLCVEVTDDHPAVPFVVEAAGDRENGRGMMLVASLATAWGSRRVGDGQRKVVWFEIPLGPPPPLS